ncbi:MAG: S23 ribosomal protein [Candidatus Woesebacteria bacterium GW2011_GWA2_40_7]|uniref:S23 ribosomal protein n=2 Tax=Candidatus Woeseibacteriota TaxID=1752722 RepID=A0A0G0P0I9_9BACT|nr:MAG: S23 ribosomal protein [Candidatus Woesebacteria bacterium GW2011_GWB1_39_10]KKR72422.1 MAG: S23 ribosomal protein [Candidatus Woesebacteria bacterium GW2011_GWA2_40_7]
MDDIVKQLIEKTYLELSQGQKPQEKSRISKTVNGYIYLVAWSNASLLRVLNKKFTDSLPKSLYRLKTQSDDATRSVVANIEEGFARQTTSEYINFLGYSRASLIEEKGDVQRSLQDGILKSAPGSSLKSLGINLEDWHEALKKSVISKPDKGSYRKLEVIKGSFKFLYDPVDSLRAETLTYEIFIELINKTDWNIRKLVESLEKKLNADKKFYQVEKMRTFEKFKR